GLRLQLTGVGVEQHDAAAVRLQGAEDQLHDAVQQLGNVDDVADGLGGFIEDAEVDQGVLQPGTVRLVGPGEQPAALRLTDGLNDGAVQLQFVARDQADLLGQFAGGSSGLPAGGVDEQRLTDLHLVAGLEQDVLDRLIVDEAAVGAADV